MNIPDLPAGLRLAVAAVLGAVAGAGAAGAGASWAVAVAVAWCVLAFVVVAWVWLVIGPMDAEGTADHARREDFSRLAADALLLGASVASLVAVAFTLVQAGRDHGTTKALLVALVVLTVALSWASVHTVFTLRYSRGYYADPVGGIDFNEDDRPDYIDFAYVALTVGMTFQVSDTNLQTKTIRRTAVRHALLSYLFGAVIVAVTINIVASLLSK